MKTLSRCAILSVLLVLPLVLPVPASAGSVDAFWKNGSALFDLHGSGKQTLLYQLQTFGISTQSCVNLAVSTPLNDGIYYIGEDGERHAFADDRAYTSWYANASPVRAIPAEQLASIPLGETMVYKPGARLIKFEADPKVYAVNAFGWLRWIQTPEVATTLFGNDWRNRIDVISDAFFITYAFGMPIVTAADYTPAR